MIIMFFTTVENNIEKLDKNNNRRIASKAFSLNGG
jgi:hypothetical protein